ncbi:MAG: hypothetical protein FWD61_07895 [Phycisphaerales bacterium]|nr:hypothetical protein [Phycisphaerales bacterium]
MKYRDRGYNYALFYGVCPKFRTFEVSGSWAWHVKQRRRETGQSTALPMGGVRVVKIDLEKLRELPAAQPDATIHEL